jgi:hypothetical protein
MTSAIYTDQEQVTYYTLAHSQFSIWLFAPTTTPNNTRPGVILGFCLCKQPDIHRLLL